MPFTPSHMAAALPFLRLPLPVAPLVIGTMAPDVPYFVPLDVPRDLTHSLPGVPTIDLAITAVLVLLWYAVLRRPLVDLLPDSLRERIPDLGPSGWRSAGRSWWSAVVLGVVAALVGILTHLIWDAFTHRSSALVQAVPVLHGPLGPLAVSSWLQHISTVGGLVVLAIWVGLWMRRVPRTRTGAASARSRLAGGITLMLAFGISGCVVWVSGIMAGESAFDPDLVFRGATLAGGVAGLTGLMICAIWWIARARRG